MRTSIAARCALVVAVTCLAGCGPSSPVSSRMEDYGKLPGLRASADSRLQEELARVEEIGGTPEALKGPEVAESENAAAVLDKVFPSRRLAGLKERSDGLVPTSGFEFNPLHFEKALKFRDEQAEALGKCREAIDRPKCDFGWDFERGFGNDLDFVDRVWLCTRLEGLDAAEKLHAEGDIDGTLENVERMLRWAELLAAEKNIYARVAAANIRDEIASVLIEAAHSLKATPRHLAKAARMLGETLESWTPDAHAWIGERAAVLHAYEAIRDGQITRFLTPDEVDRLAAERSLVELTGALQRSVDADELFYLQAMRRIIESCDEPYHARRGAIEEITTEAESLRGSNDYPFAAAELFLKDIDPAQRHQALDRAQYEAMYLALLHAAGQSTERFKVSPASGKPYQVRRDGGLVVVEDPGQGSMPGFSIGVPVKAEGGGGRRRRGREEVSTKGTKGEGRKLKAMDAGSQEALDAFGEAVVREVYDRSCMNLLITMLRGMRGIKPDPLHLAYQSLDPDTARVLRQFVTKAVDQTFAQFLAFLDNHEISIPFPTHGGEARDVTAVSDGLAAEPYTEWGWIARFSEFKDGIPESE